MAFQQGASSSFSSSSNRRWTYDVFLSFRGEDTRHNFTAHLYHALLQKGINTFIDDDQLRSGEEISPTLLNAIEDSKISIIVLSQNYASSTWCLDELLKILVCKDTNGQMILPIFYKVDPSDVRHQNKSFEKAFTKHQERFKDDIKVHRWKAALMQVASLSGWHLENYENEAKFIDNIVQTVSRIVNPTYLHVAKYPVGIEPRVQHIKSLLSMEINDRRMVGILGAGGIGKTTIAKAIYNLIASRFEGSCFLANVSETSKQYLGLVQLQNTLLSRIVGHTMKVDSVDEGIIMIKKMLCSKRVLLILDDVDDKLVQLDKLVGEVDWFGLGSRIIITTRDRKVLTNHGIVDDLIYKVKELDSNEALELICWNAFKGDKPTDDFIELMEHAIRYAGCLPLALEVLGSDLHGKDIHQWKRWPADHVIKILDSCDFFPIDGIKVLIERSLITIDTYKTLAMHDLLQDMGREVVRQESPEDPSKRSRLWFHKDVCYVLENGEGTSKIQGILVDLPEGNMMRLSFKAFKKMKRLRLLMVKPNAHFSGELNFLSNELRLLDWHECPLESLSSIFHIENLAALRIPGSPLKRLEGIENFQSMKIMDFSYCEFLKIFPDVSRISNLEDLRLDGCTNLVEIHHSVGFLDKLVSLSLGECYNLSSFPRSLKLRSLEFLCVTGCSMLNYFPEIECEMECLEEIIFANTGIKELPSSISYLIGLTKLRLQGNINLMHLPSSIYELQSIKRIFLDGCSKLVKFPKKMGDIRQSMSSNVFREESEISLGPNLLPLPPPTNSSVFNDDCSSIVFPALQQLHCILLESSFFRIFNCSSTLVVLNLSGSAIVTIPACLERFVCLCYLNLNNCKQLRKILKLPPSIKDVCAEGCKSLETFFGDPRTCQLFNTWWLPDLVWYETTFSTRGPVGSGAPAATYQNVQTVAIPQPLRGPLQPRYFHCLVSGNKIPDWFNHHVKVSNSNSCQIKIDKPAEMLGEFTIIAYSAVVRIKDVEEDDDVSHEISTYVSTTNRYISTEIYSDTAYLDRSASEYVWLHFHVPQYSFKLPSVDHVQVKFEVTKPFYFKSCGFHLVRLCNENAIDLIDGIQRKNRPVPCGDGNLESNKSVILQM
ncbi:TMV resistance protein N-like [Corylus avellana]|uniref:TMV resistance protein N-like n=1 Tax=Corylus avellana TaxID=13451 RepID=UPI00286D2F0B|nr:TMV resistance protein N-like [Corylus avellana]